MACFTCRTTLATLDAKSYSLTGLATPKASYSVPRFGAFLGGPLNIPKIFNGGNKTFFFAGWNGNRGSTPYDAFSTVPTLAERNGDFSAATYKDGSPVQVFNPATGQQFQSNGQLNIIDPVAHQFVREGLAGLCSGAQPE